VTQPFSAFNFRVEIRLPGAEAPLCDAAFAECEGLELRLDVHVLREGGDNARQRLLAGPASYGEVTLRRGMTSSFDLWDWCGAVMHDPSLRADALVIMLAPDGATEQARFRLSRCLPVRLRAPRLDARYGIVAIEELRLACESLVLERPGEDEPTGGPEVKAELVELDEQRRREVGAKRRVIVQFNPHSLSLAHAEDGGSTLAFALWFDVGVGDDVRRLTEPISALAARPAVRFRWGAFRFDGRIATLDQQLDRFSSDGRPLRAAVAITMRATRA
jgi:phage tail-like protein